MPGLGVEGGNMFVQVIRGQVTDPQQLHAALDTWSQRLSGASPGWLGSTAGVTDAGQFVGLARFESEAAAQRNSNRPEQDRWWAETAKLFDGEVSFSDSDDIIADLHGDPNTAGFVQVMQGNGTDPERAKELMMSNPDEMAALRPDVVGSLAVDHAHGDYTMAIYFTSEEDARAGERVPMPPEARAVMEELGKLNTREPEFLDLKDPWLYSPHHN
jgi:hypothetical protein